ncbi:hypothetical protein FBUS_00719 [Fasciolopsis buskii]|uniref:Uncharacterized protein n=1 Tax=Fasciolopsis buskii TaxID=27845 RepID=A0A8E0RLP8_9TREM|nr:hypothetical protein FBUS_00719 [Fasciolopsis buski]
MEDRPLKAGGTYNINWDEIDENFDPFGSKSTAKSSAKSPKPAPPPRSPAKVTSKGDGPASVEPPISTIAPTETKTAVSPSQPPIEPVDSPKKEGSGKPSAQPQDITTPNEQEVKEPLPKSESPKKAAKATPAVRKPISTRVPNGQPEKRNTTDDASKPSDSESDEFPKPSRFSCILTAYESYLRSSFPVSSRV